MNKKPEKKRDYLKELIDRFKEPVVETGFTNTQEIPTLRNHPCTDDISAINVASTTSFFDNLISTRLIEEPIETVSLDKIRELHKEIYKAVMEQEGAIMDNLEEAKYDAPPDIRMIKKILEQGYIDAAKRVIDLINLEIRIRKEQIEQDRTLANKPTIENNFSLIRALLLLFRKADKCREMFQIEEEATIYLNLANYHNKEGVHWLWLAYEFFTMSINSCNDYRGDNGLTEATVRYIFGKFCLLRLKYVKEAMTHLEKACKLSAGRSWTASGYTGIKDDYIYPTARSLLHSTHIAMIIDGEVTDPKDILYHLQEALIISETEEEYLEILVPLADAYNNVGNTREAIKYLKQYIIIAKDNPKVPEHMALTNMDFVKDVELRFYYYYTKADNDILAIHHLYNAYKISKWSKDMKTEALVYKFYGLMFLKMRFFSCANCMLRHSYRMYCGLELFKDAEEVTGVLTYHKFLSYFRRFIEIVKITSRLDYDQLSYKIPECQELFDFIDNGKPFWKTYRQEADPPIIDEYFPIHYLCDVKNFNEVPKNAKLNKHEKMVMNVYKKERPIIKDYLREKRRKFYYNTVAEGLTREMPKRYREKKPKRECELIAMLKKAAIDYKIPEELLTYSNTTPDSDGDILNRKASDQDEAQWFIDWEGMSSSDDEFYGRSIGGDPGSVNYTIPTVHPPDDCTRLFHLRKHATDGKVFVPFSNDVSRLLATCKDTTNMYLVSEKPMKIDKLPDIQQDPNSPMYEHQQTMKREFFYEHRDELRYIIQQKFKDF